MGIPAGISTDLYTLTYRNVQTSNPSLYEYPQILIPNVMGIPISPYVLSYRDMHSFLYSN
jgi:hypothetical protein